MAGVLVSVLRGVGLYVVAGSAQSQFDTYCVRWMRRVHVVIKWGVFRLTRARALAWGPLLPHVYIETSNKYRNIITCLVLVNWYY